MYQVKFCLVAVLSIALAACGCRSPYHADRGAAIGGLTGAGVGALVGNAVGKTAGGALIGAGLGALVGNGVGQTLDDIEAENRALIEAQLGQPVAAGAVTVDDVVLMSQNHVADELIINHIRAHGPIAPATTDDLIHLQQAGVTPPVMQAYQTTPVPTVSQGVPPATVVVEDHYYGPPPVAYHYHHGRFAHRRRPRVGWGVSVSSGH